MPLVHDIFKQFISCIVFRSQVDMTSYLIQILLRISDIAAEITSLGIVQIDLCEADKPEVCWLVIPSVFFSFPGCKIQFSIVPAGPVVRNGCYIAFSRHFDLYSLFRGKEGSILSYDIPLGIISVYQGLSRLCATEADSHIPGH